MASVEKETLSQDELRKRLYQTFKNRGVLDTLKTQLRNQLIHELMHPILSGELQPQAVPSEGSSLLITASNSLVADHLQRCGYEYSLSVFFPESGLEKKKLWTMQDLLQFMRITPKSSLYKSLTSETRKENKGFLMQILIGLTEHHLSKETHDTETQTNSVPPYRESLAEKLQLIDEEFADSYPWHQKYESLEAKLHEYRKEIEKQFQAEMCQKLEHFKEVEIAKIKMEEKVQTQKEISELRHELERAHQAKAEALISREKNAIERLQKQQEIEAKEVYAQRQSLLKDIEVIRTREAELKQRIEAFEVSQKLQEEKNKAIDDALRRREVAVKNIEDTYDQKLKTDLLKYQLELKEEYIARTTKVTEDEKKNKEKALLLHEEAIAVNSKKEELKQAISHTKELELDLESVRAQVLLLNKQNQLLTEKLKDLSDYPLLKEEKLELQVQNKLLRQQLDETRSENQHLRDKLSQPSAEHLACQVELRRVEHSKKLALDEFESYRQTLEKQLQSEVERCAQLKAQLLDSETTVRKLNVQVEELKLQVKQTQAALENEVYRNPKPSLVDRSVLDFTDDRAVPHDIYVDHAFLKNQVMTDAMKVNVVPRAGYWQQLQPHSASMDSDLECMAQTRARIKELQKEAECLEEAYRNYRCSVMQDAAASRTQRKMQSPLLLQCATSRPPLSAQHEVVEDSPRSQHSPLSSPRGEKDIARTGSVDGFKNLLTPPHRRTSVSRCLSSTPVSKVERDLSNKKVSDDTSHLYLNSSQQSVDKVLSPISKPYPLSSSESVSSSPSSHGQKIRLHNQQTGKPDFSDIPKPDKLIYEDLEECVSSLEYQGDIPEQCESDALHPCEDIVNGNHVTATVPAAATSLQDLTVLDEKQIEEQDREVEKNLEEEEEEERKAREERGEKELQEALEKQQKEEEKLNKEQIQDSVKIDEEKEDKEGVKSENSNSGAEDNVKDPTSNPLEKYMKLIQQRRANKDSKKETEVSLTEGFGLSEKDDSTADISHGDMDESFW
ncbi:centriole and centriolar satellite protein OFD1 isoform X1 [Melopsittacus undulatus]|uniref:centriole and centriolar satellite protein OFD1 isoform X1 n=1 Tax=Melopsittacus undulatus TaxID=13146 RepID=UPI000661F8CC|nr:oral-facial-digital syndrome 1 protein isoform X1 [Melopsittacus undulatus]XP_030907058.1 oral-facial-digital syndrome 1 protein isoform X1 [Melopsittacus undulatus]XP_030907059.1 oral-facial-digital syndrome 1 protein isoform X1 [Melopsittacus undulatus]